MRLFKKRGEVKEFYGKIYFNLCLLLRGAAFAACVSFVFQCKLCCISTIVASRQNMPFKDE
jgi:hypothetical protein